MRENIVISFLEKEKLFYHFRAFYDNVEKGFRN